MFSFFNAYTQADKVKTYLKEMVAIASEEGVWLYHENEKDIYGDTLARVNEILAEVEGLRAVYDPANFLQVGEKADDTLDALVDKVGYFHIKDVIVETGQIVPAGEGDGKIDEMLARIDRDTVVTLEPHLAIFDRYATIDNTEMKHKFTYASANEAFDSAVTALKKLLNEVGYREENGVFVK
jgi:sugar phosphate isomerase/epimerase